MRLLTIGFTKTSAERFFGRLRDAQVRQVWDTRINRTSQLAGFAKEKDLKYFLSEIGHTTYKIEELLAPTRDLLKLYQDQLISWNEYEKAYLDLLSDRQIERRFHEHDLDGVCLLCSEATPEHCHRRLAANYLRDAISGLEVKHL